MESNDFLCVRNFRFWEFLGKNILANIFFREREGSIKAGIVFG